MATTRLECFRNTIEKTFLFLRSTKSLDDLFAKSIAIQKGEGGFWVPLGELHRKNPQFNELLTLFLKNAQEPINSTKNIITDLATRNSPSQQGFLLVDQFGNWEGLTVLEGNDFESQTVKCVDLILRELAPARIEMALGVLADWAYGTLAANRFELVGPKHFTSLNIESPRILKEANSLLVTPDDSQIGKQEILTAGPSIGAQESSYTLDAVRYGWNNEWSKYIKKFEQQFADYVGVKHALGTSSCTGALHIALTALGIGPGDEVIVPDITWVATASAVTYVGATPVFADIDPLNWCINPEAVERVITPRTKCIMPVHLYGHPADMDKIMAIANKHGLFVVEDAAPAIGAECRGKKAGSFGHFAAFSFQGAKLLVTGEGGMLVTNDPDLYKKAYEIWDHGRTPGTFWINKVGLKYKMANVQAAIGLGQLERAEEQIHQKRQIYGWYRDILNHIKGAKLCGESDWARSIFWMTSLQLDPQIGITREQFFAKLKEKKIDTRPVFPAIGTYPMWAKEPNPVAKLVGDYGVNLPSGVHLTKKKVEYVAETIKEILTQK